jgi:5'(3')-deoxyribonucleotidase
MSTNQFVFGVDLDGVCADFYGRMREIVAEWRGVPVDQLTTQVTYGLPEWDMTREEYEKVHRFAVTQRKLFRAMDPIPGAPQVLRKLGAEGVRIRIITHRLFIDYFHAIAVAQTTKWLDNHSIPYSDLCFMKDKCLVGANLYIEDTPDNIRDLQEAGKRVIAFTNSTNRTMQPPPRLRANSWEEVEAMARDEYKRWLEGREWPMPTAS